ncbi:MAG: MFS transporter [Actinomycetaceae bacterium]|nr:MFS transporter [Actinomycetaceae bacterium]
MSVQEGVNNAQRPVPANGFRTFALIWLVQMVARIGNGLTAFGLVIFAYQQTGLSTSVALITLCAFLPAVLLAPAGGILADRHDRRLLMILSDSISAVGLLALLIAFTAGIASVPIICVCVAFSAVFNSVMEPAYRATVTDLLTPDQYARGAGMVQLASASQFLISPALAGILIANFGIRLILAIDISTMAFTILAMILIRRRVPKPSAPATRENALTDLRFGIAFLRTSRGVLTLTLVATLVTFCMGFLQTLLTPMILDLANEGVLGWIRSIAATGMLVSGLLIGVFSMGSRHLTWIFRCLLGGGVLIALMGTTTNLWLIGALAFGFFMVLPPLNASVEVLARAAIPNEVQGRVWGLIGLVSQLGYIAAYAVSGVLADLVFNPLLRPGGPLAHSLGVWLGVGPSRGIGLMLMLVGAILIFVASAVPNLRSLEALQRDFLQKIDAQNPGS